MAFKSRTYRDKPLRLTNSLGGKKVDFKPVNPPQVSFYSCGPTVYGPLHIGNARALFVPEMMTRWLRHIGYTVNFVRNYTDVDDKIIKRAHEEKTSSEQVAEKYIEYCETDMALMGLGKPNKTVRVTESIDEIIKIVTKLIERGHAYVANGEVFYSIESFKEYGKLSGKKTEDLQAGARVEVDAHKRNPLDFSLWKPHKPGEPFWPSPWGNGRPGWHIECSAMVSRWLGESIDLHHGGQDLIFPHHENEIAQSEGATGKSFCAHWVHNGFLTVSREKMSKSLGNILEIRQFLEKYGAEFLRYLFIKHHYRSAFDFDEPAAADMISELERIYSAKQWALDAVAAAKEVTGESASDAAFQPLKGRSDTVFHGLEDEMFNDFNTPGALGHLFMFIREINRAEGEAAGQAGLKAAPGQVRAQVASEFLSLLTEGFKPLLNVFGDEPATALSQLDKIRRDRKPAASQLSDSAIQTFIEERKQARQNKDFKRADEIRIELEAQGIILVDAPGGTTWKMK